MRVEPTGVVMNGICSVQTEHCIAKDIAPITVVWELPARRQVNVCHPCLEAQIRAGRWTVESAKVKSRADLAIYDPKGRLQLVVEVRQPLEPSSLSWRTWVRRIHRNLYAHSGIPASEYFLVVGFPNFYALWRGQPMPFGRRPDFEGDLGAILTDYLTNSAKETRIPGYEAERAVESWLKTLVDAVQPPDNPQLKWLADSGLFDRIKNGVVQREALRRTITHA